jgi:hypothetical protein
VEVKHGSLRELAGTGASVSENILDFALYADLFSEQLVPSFRYALLTMLTYYCWNSNRNCSNHLNLSKLFTSFSSFDIPDAANMSSMGIANENIELRS